jgi:hypothetical protein
MSLHDEFEALKHLPHELAAWVKSLIHRVDPTDAPGEPVAVPEVFDEATPAAPAPEGAEHA